MRQQAGLTFPECFKSLVILGRSIPFGLHHCKLALLNVRCFLFSFLNMGPEVTNNYCLDQLTLLEYGCS